MSEFRARFNKLLGQRDLLLKQKKDTEAELKAQQRQGKIADMAGDVVREVALQTQKQLEFHLSEVVSTAQDSVFDDPYGMVVRFEERRGKTECDLLFSRDGKELDPLASSGYGPVDVAAFALRIASWSMQKASAPIFLLDEPFKHLKGEAENRRAIQMVHEFSNQLGCQMIMVSDERAPREDIIAGADRVFEVKKTNGVSRVEVIL